MLGRSWIVANAFKNEVTSVWNSGCFNLQCFFKIDTQLTYTGFWVSKYLAMNFCRFSRGKSLRENMLLFFCADERRASPAVLLLALCLFSLPAFDGADGPPNLWTFIFTAESFLSLILKAIWGCDPWPNRQHWHIYSWVAEYLSYVFKGAPLEKFPCLDWMKLFQMAAFNCLFTTLLSCLFDGVWLFCLNYSVFNCRIFVVSW